MRPIDADEAHDKLTALYKNAQGKERKAYSAALDIITEADTIEKPLTIPDVERVLNEATVYSACFNERITLREFMNRVQKGECKTHRHGLWINLSGWCNRGVVKCSECGNTLDMHGVNAGRGDANFCPNCGLKMDGGTITIGKEFTGDEAERTN